MAAPSVVIVLSGKRKSGKDYVANLMQTRLGCDVCSIMRLSGPLKKQYAKEHDLDYERLLDTSDYKEQFRADMIRWGEDRRNKDPSFFCRLTTEQVPEGHSVWIISDARRTTDLEYFRKRYPQTIAVRIEAADTVRKERGFIFTPGVDDAESECGLDNVKDWTWTLTNNSSPQLEEKLTLLLNHIQSKLS